MTLSFLLDENLRGRLWQALERNNATSEWLLDVIRVGDSPDLPLGMRDAEVLRWIDRETRILVSLDKSTMPLHLSNTWQRGTIYRESC